MNINKEDYNLGDNFYRCRKYQELQKTISYWRKLLKSAETKQEQFNCEERVKRELNKLEILEYEVIQLTEVFKRLEANTDNHLSQAKFHFDKGEFNEARIILYAKKMMEELKESLNNTNNLHKKADEFLLLALLTSISLDIPNQFEEINKFYKKSIKANYNQFNLSAYAYFLQKNSNYTDAIYFYKEVLSIYQKSAKRNPQYYNDCIASTLRNLGFLHRTSNNLIQAKKYYEEALELYQQLEKNNSLTYSEDIKQIRDNLTSFKSNTNISLVQLIKSNIVDNNLHIENIKAGKDINVYVKRYINKLPDYKNIREEIKKTEKDLQNSLDENYEFLHQKLHNLYQIEKDFITSIYLLGELFAKSTAQTGKLKEAMKLFNQGKVKEADDLIKSADSLKDQFNLILIAEYNEAKLNLLKSS